MLLNMCAKIYYINILNTHIMFKSLCISTYASGAHPVVLVSCVFMAFMMSEHLVVIIADGEG